MKSKSYWYPIFIPDKNEVLSKGEPPSAKRSSLYPGAERQKALVIYST